MIINLDFSGTEIVSVTISGLQCKLPFKHDNQVFNACIYDKYKPWCVVQQEFGQSENTTDICLSHWGMFY